MRRWTVMVICAGALLMASRASAQTPAGALVDLLGSFQGALLSDDAEAVRAMLTSEATTFPIGSSAGGFTWTFDTQLGVATRRSNSFGPMFAERPLTNGHRKLNLSVTFQHTDFDSLAGQKLDDLRLVFQDPDFTDAYTSSLSVSTDRTIVALSYGVTERVDVGIVVPFGRTHVSGNATNVFSFNGRVIDTSTITADSSGSGIGDIILRGKAALPQLAMFDLAAGVDLRLPSGSKDNLLGTGKASAKVALIGAMTNSRNISPHFNVGYTFAGKGLRFDENTFDVFFDPSDEFDYTLGVDVAATPSVTINGDVIGRLIKNGANFSIETSNDPNFSFSGITSEFGKVNLLLGTVGAKVKIGGMWLLAGSVVFPLNSNGIKPGITPVIGFERAF